MKTESKDEQKPLTDFLEQNYYVEQRKVMDEWIIEQARSTPNGDIVTYCETLQEKLRDMASTYVHGANLTAVISSNRQLRAALEEVRTHLDAIRGAFGELVAHYPEGTGDRVFYEHELKAAWEYAKLIQEALNQTTESAK